MQDKDAVIGVILAGGQSRRMGKDKALLKLPQGKSCLQNSIDVLSSCGLHKIIISVDRQPYPFKQNVEVDVTFINDKVRNLGPLAALSSVISQSQVNRLIIVAVDMPVLNKQQIKRLMLENNEDSHAPKSRYFAQHFLPLNLYVDNLCKSTIGQCLAASEPRDRSLKKFLSLIPIQILPVKSAEKHHLQNTNTPAQWQQFLASTEGSFKNVS